MGPVQNRGDDRARDDDGIRVRYFHNCNHAPLNRPTAYQDGFSDDENFAEAVFGGYGGVGRGGAGQGGVGCGSTGLEDMNMGVLVIEEPMEVKECTKNILVGNPMTTV